MKKIIFVVIVSLVLTTIPFVGGCGWASGLEAAGNRDKLNKIEIGMTKNQLQKVMGNPRTREAQGQYEWWFYVTESGSHPFYGHTSDSTPVCLSDGKVIGWGRKFYDDTKKYEVKVEQGTITDHPAAVVP